jgi:hypothetical protein
VELLTQHKVRISVTNAGPLMGAVEWDKFSGGDLTHSVTKLRRTAGGKKEAMSADSEYENIVLEAFVDPEAYADLLLDLKKGERYEGATVAAQPINNAGIPIGKALEYYKCSVATSKLIEADANGEDPSKLVVEWAVGHG